MNKGILWGVAIVVVSASIYAYQVGKNSGVLGVQNTATVAVSDSANQPMRGALVCLGEEDLECEVGFKSDQGMTYGLDKEGAEFIDGELTPGRNVWVLGTVSPGAYDGVIAVRAIVANNK